MDIAKATALLKQTQAGLASLQQTVADTLAQLAPDPTPTPAPVPTPAPTPAPVKAGRVPENPLGLVRGVAYDYYQAAGAYTTMPNFDTEKVFKTGILNTPDLGPAERPDNFAFRYKGYIYAPADGDYTFFTKSDDGSQLWIGNELIVNNNAIQAPTERSGTIALQKGWHKSTIGFFEFNNTQELSVSYAGPGLAKQVIPASAYGYVPAAKPATPNAAPTITGVTATLR